ncbi:Rpn family recombination-promoting nuclease/putative transposase [Halanaerocella petrolearia]
MEKELEEVFSDILYKVSLNNKDAYIYLLFEHKSYTYKKISIQLLKYLIKIWELKLKQTEREKLPLVIPMVFYHGRQEWNIELNLSSLLGEIPEELEKYIPDFEYLLYDLSPYSEEEIKGTAKARVFLEIIRAIFSDDFKERVKEALLVLDKLEEKETGMEYFETVVKYIMSAKDDLTEKELKEVAKEISTERSEKIMTIAEKLREEGKKEGKKEGKREGKREMAKNLLNVGVEIDKIVEASGLSEKEIKEIKKKTRH